MILGSCARIRGCERILWRFWRYVSSGTCCWLEQPGMQASFAPNQTLYGKSAEILIEEEITEMLRREEG